MALIGVGIQLNIKKNSSYGGMPPISSLAMPLVRCNLRGFVLLGTREWKRGIRAKKWAVEAPTFLYQLLSGLCLVVMHWQSLCLI